MVMASYKRFPDFFGRLGQCEDAVYLIDPLDLSFVLTLQLQAGRPRVRAYRRRQAPTGCTAHVSGLFHDLMALLQGQEDSDALFFSRRLTIEGDTAAIVTLRNALDNLNADIIGAVTATLRPPLRIAARLALRHLERQRHAA